MKNWIHSRVGYQYTQEKGGGRGCSLMGHQKGQVEMLSDDCLLKHIVIYETYCDL